MLQRSYLLGGGEKKLDLKSILKSLKLNESNISMVLGALVVVVVGVLVVNYFKEQKQGSTLTGTSNENANLPEGAKSHTVAKGENLWNLAVQYYQNGYKWGEISKANNLTNPGNLEVGQKLVIPALAEKVQQKTAEPITGATYQVVKGDNLWNIAVRAYGDGYKYSEIARENKLVHPNLIHPGNILILPR